MGYKSNIPPHVWTNPGFNLISKVINLVTFTNCLKGKKCIFYRQIMVLNFTRYPKKLNVKSPITLRRNKIYLLIYCKTVSLRSYAVIYPSIQLPNHQIQTQFKKKNLISFKKYCHKSLETNFLNTKLVSRSLQTVVIKLAYSPTRFVQLLAPNIFLSARSKAWLEKLNAGELRGQASKINLNLRGRARRAFSPVWGIFSKRRGLWKRVWV